MAQVTAYSTILGHPQIKRLTGGAKLGPRSGLKYTIKELNFNFPTLARPPRCLKTRLGAISSLFLAILTPLIALETLELLHFRNNDVSNTESHVGSQS